MDFLTSCKNFINREIREENEPKETAVMIRVLCLVDFLFLTINSIVVLEKFGPSVACVAFGLDLLMIIAFGMSYYVKMYVLVYVYYLAIVLNVAVLVLFFGLSYMFQAQLYIIFMIFFYRAAGNVRERIVAVVLSIILVLSLIFYVGVNGHVIQVSPYGNSFVTIYCTLYVMAKSSVFAFFFRKKFSASEEKIIRYSKRLEMLATTDPLTKLQNRRGMLNHIEETTKKLTSSNTGLLTLVIGDIDLFKSINDTYGHEAGDYVLETLAKIMNEFMDNKGMVARWGGEEFLFSFEGINGDYAFEETSRLLHLIEKYEFSYEGTPIKVTMTFGIEEFDSQIGIDKVISKADEKLYMGKKQGRNRVIY